MKKLFWLSLGLMSIAAFAQNDSTEIAEVTETAVIEDTAKTVESTATAPVAVQEESAQTAATQPQNSSPTATEKLAMEYFMRQMDLKTETTQESVRNNFVLLSFRVGGRALGETGDHIISTIELGGINKKSKFYIGGDAVWGNRIGGAGINLGMVINAKENVFMMIPGVFGCFQYSNKESDINSNIEITKKDYSFGGAFFKILIGSGGKVFVDITNRLYTTKSEKTIREKVEYSEYWGDYYQYQKSDSEKIGVSYMGSIGISLLL